MVTFVCSYCDATLKKKQTEKHAFGSCRPASFICIDCHVTFQGNDYKNHTSCLTEFEKHWGEYAKPKQITQGGNQAQKNGNGNQSVKKEEVKPAVEKVEEQVPENGDEVAWKGWKNELKDIIKENQKNISLENLQNIAIKRYREFSKEDEKDEELIQIIKDKVSKLKKVKLVTYVTLE